MAKAENPGEVKLPATGPAAIPQGLIRPDEQVILAIKPSLAFILLQSLLFIDLVVLALAACWILHHARLFVLPVWHVAGAALVALFIRLLVAFVQWLARTYILTDKRIIRIKGVFWVQIFESGIERVQNVTLSVPLLQRAVGVGTILFATAGTAGLDVAWLMVHPAQVLQKVADILRRADDIRAGAMSYL